MPHQIFKRFHIRFAGPRAAQRQRQNNGLVPHLHRDEHSVGQGIYAWHVKHRAVRKYAYRAHQRQFAKRQRSLINLNFRKPPGVRRCVAKQNMPRMIGMAFVLLQMLGLQQHAFAPNDLFSPTHGSIHCQDKLKHQSLTRSSTP